jgi:hypothetical protein
MIIGLNPINNVGRRHVILNYDMSHLIHGHARYREHIQAIMNEVDFDNDLKILYD